MRKVGKCGATGQLMSVQDKMTTIPSARLSDFQARLREATVPWHTYLFPNNKVMSRVGFNTFELRPNSRVGFRPTVTATLVRKGELVEIQWSANKPVLLNGFAFIWFAGLWGMCATIYYTSTGQWGPMGRAGPLIITSFMTIMGTMVFLLQRIEYQTKVDEVESLLVRIAAEVKVLS